MRLSDLLKAEVLDERDRRIGVVCDVRLVQDGPTLGEQRAAFRLHGLIVGFRWPGARFGLNRPEVRGPWLLKRIFKRSSDRYVPFEAVRSIEEGRVRIRGTREHYGAPRVSHAGPE